MNPSRRLIFLSLLASGLLGGCNACGSDSNRAATATPTQPNAPKTDDSPPPTAPSHPSSTERAWLAGPGFAYERISRQDGIVGLRQSAVRAVVTLDRIAEECSGMGGTHLVFQLESDAAVPEFARFGGHGVQLPVADSAGRSNLNASSAKDGNGFETGSVYVAGMEPNTVTPTRGWCIDALPKSKWRVIVLVPVTSLEEGEQLLGDVDTH